MKRTHDFYLVILGCGLKELSRATSEPWTEDNARLCEGVLTMIEEIPVVLSILLTEDAEQEGRLYDELTKEAARTNLSGLLDAWMACARQTPAEKTIPADRFFGSVYGGFSVISYVLFLWDAAERMTENKGDPKILHAFSETFHELPEALRYAWTAEREARAYEVIMRRATEQGIRVDVEAWMHEHAGEEAKLRAARLRF